ncbi:MAG: acylneuraminate cytidylyltransferase family protein, partial [Chitinophagaceae bacterium]|nr:acylneuraminate cytidylyltransferase family protein [Chitinophagaceae bacterium]
EPRQRLPKTYWQIGTLDVIRPHVITEQHSMSGDVIMPHVVDAIFAVDIDDLSSFNKAAEVITEQDCVKFDA